MVDGGAAEGHAEQRPDCQGPPGQTLQEADRCWSGMTGFKDSERERNSVPADLTARVPQKKQGLIFVSDGDFRECEGARKSPRWWGPEGHGKERPDFQGPPGQALLKASRPSVR